MEKNIILIAQAKIFNNNLTKETIDYIIQNNILIYNNINNYSNCEEDINKNYLLDEITWVYDNNNYRIPLINNHKINEIKFIEHLNIFDYLSSATLIDNINIICGEQFIKISDCFIGSLGCINANPNNINLSKNIVNIENIEDNNYEVIRTNNIFFIKTDDLVNFYNKTNQQNMNDKIIITHNSDYGINIEMVYFLNKIKKQFSQNCMIKHNNLVSIPIGIENKQWFDHDIFHEIRLRNDIKKEKDIYFFFSLNTHYTRKECYEKLKDKLNWNTKLSKKDYFIELKKHKYAVCPRGNGLDTHRIWECLYLDVIPIMLRSDFINIDNLPIIYLEKWDELDIEKIKDIKFNNIEFSKITLSYYINKIRSF